MYIVVGLGNPGKEYENTRHNAGRLALAEVAKLESPKLKILVPDTFMNKSGSAVAKAVKSKQAAKKLIVLYDDLDLPLGVLKISYNRGSGGHKGIESIVRALKTKEFIRIRIGITPTTPTGKLKKPGGEKAVQDFILTDFKKGEREKLNKVLEKSALAVKKIVEDGLPSAMNEFNSG